MDHRCIQVPTFHDIRKKEENTIPNSMIRIFMAGFCLGMVFFYLSDKAYAKESGLMDTTHIRQLQEFRANKTGLLQYVAVRRIWQFFLVGLCACSKLCSILLQLLIGVCGFSLGILPIQSYGVISWSSTIFTSLDSLYGDDLQSYAYFTAE